MKKIAFKKWHRRFHNKGYRNVNFEKILKQTPSNRNDQNSDLVLLQTDFINDRFNKKINKILKQYNFPIRNISKPNKKISQRLAPPSTSSLKHKNCEICDLLPEKNSCTESFLVYKITCKYCHNFYIGETCRPFHFRFHEHRRSLLSRDGKSALSDHANNHHADLSLTIADFLFTFVAKSRNPVDTRISEAHCIDLLNPSLNRKVEKAQV